MTRARAHATPRGHEEGATVATSQITDRQPWHLDRGRKAGEMGYIPGLDGIRALAVLGVLLYHGDLTWMQGGFLGVDVFFVLSGFLITTLIVEEYSRSGRIDFKRFYLARARRLLHVGATRAVHQLWMTTVGATSPIVREAMDTRR
jgi:hypothetical protein